MSTEPTYPSDAAVESPAGIPLPSPSLTGGETLGVAMSANETAKNADDAARGKNTRNFVAGAAIGVGSAALVAALLYASRSRRGDGQAERDAAAARMMDDAED